MHKTIKKILFFTIEHLWRNPRANYYRKEEVPRNTDPAFLKAFATDLANGIRWCSETTVHLAEIKVVDITKSVITFDLALLGFNGAAHTIFQSRFFLLFSVISAIISIILLLWFWWSTINKNINNISDRKLVLHKAFKGIMENADPLPTLNSYEEELNESFEDLKTHEEMFMPIQRLGIVFFVAAVTTSLAGILFGYSLFF